MRWDPSTRLPGTPAQQRFCWEMHQEAPKVAPTGRRPSLARQLQARRGLPQACDGAGSSWDSKSDPRGSWKPGRACGSPCPNAEVRGLQWEDSCAVGSRHSRTDTARARRGPAAGQGPRGAATHPSKQSQQQGPGSPMLTHRTKTWADSPNNAWGVLKQLPRLTPEVAAFQCQAQGLQCIDWAVGLKEAAGQGQCLG